jgi:hypothetical protein
MGVDACRHEHESILGPGACAGVCAFAKRSASRYPHIGVRERLLLEPPSRNEERAPWRNGKKRR